MRFQKLILFVFVLCLALSMRGEDASRPWTFWYWMYGAVSKEGIKADLQGMKDIGLGGCYLMPIRGVEERPEYRGEAQQLSPKFWEMVSYAMQQADSLGLELGVHICDGFALAGGPWITPAESMQKVVFCDTIVSGNLQGVELPRPAAYQGYYEDIATFAIPLSKKGIEERLSPHVTTSSTMTCNAKGVYVASEPAWIQYDYQRPQTFRNVEIAANGTNMQAQRMTVEVSDDGEHYRLVKQLVPPRQGWQNYDYNTTFAFPLTTARYWRLSWTPEGTEPGSEDLDAAKWRPRLGLKKPTWGFLPKIDNWEGKAGYAWRIAPATTNEEIPDADCMRKQDLIRLQLAGDKIVGAVVSSLKKGQTYRILRIGHTSTGYTNATAGGGKGLECDKFSASAVNKQIDSWFAKFAALNKNGAPLKYFHVDSWECGCQNWSSRFADEFRIRRGYDLIPYLPVMTGVPVESAEKSEQVLRDVRQTIDDLLHEVFFATVRDRAHAMGMQFSSESVAPTMVSDGMRHYQYADMPMGEFWLNSPTHDKPNDMLDAISGAHIYGKKMIQAEGFTEVRGVWDETPASVKPLLDRNFALGMNKLFFHVNTHNPWLDKKPGMTLDGIGLFFQRDQTWYKESKGFVDYVTRCQRLLQQGDPVVDIAVYAGEEIPCRAILPDRLVSMLPGLFGKERVASEQQRLANVGQPMEESPVGVRHSANIFDMKDWINPLHGYQYDTMNKDALLNRPFHYKVLVIPEGCLLSEEVKAKVEALRSQGVLVIDKPYWKNTIDGVLPDVVLPKGVAYTHRKAEDKEIYFFSNQKDSFVNLSASIHATGCRPVLYDPVRGDTLPIVDCWKIGDYTHIGLPMNPYESFFILFDHSEQSQKLNEWLQEERRKIQQGNFDILSVLPKKLILDTQNWDILFQESGIRLQKQSLFDWSKHPDERIRYFSGHAHYTTTVKLKEKDASLQHATLTFYGVKDMAHVWVNGKDCGIVWTEPSTINVSGTLKSGKNIIEIEVVNTWHNALRGADQGKAPYEGIWTNAKYRTKGDELLPAGLLEPPLLIIRN